MEIAKLSTELGYFIRFKVHTETRPFELVEDACEKAGYSIPPRPTYMDAVARMVAGIRRSYASSVMFPEGSPNRKWTEMDNAGNVREYDKERNPCYSLKIEQVKQVRIDLSQSYTIHIHDKREHSSNDPHILTATFSPAATPNWQKGADIEAFDKFGSDLKWLIETELDRYYNNYDDNDVRGVINKELTRLKSLEVLGRTTNFIPRSPYVNPTEEDQLVHELQVTSLIEFVQAIHHSVRPFNLANGGFSNNSLVEELADTINAQLDDIESELEKKLNKAPGKNKRRWSGREALYDKSNEYIDKAVELANYHAAALGCVIHGFDARVDELRKKTKEFFTKDFTKNRKETEPLTTIPEKKE
jgi:hypothetical protein